MTSPPPDTLGRRRFRRIAGDRRIGLRPPRASPSPLDRRRELYHGSLELSGWLQIVRGGFAGAPVCHNLIGDLLPFIQVTHARPLDRAYVDENVRAAAIRLNETKTLRRIK